MPRRRRGARTSATLGGAVLVALLAGVAGVARADGAPLSSNDPSRVTSPPAPPTTPPLAYPKAPSTGGPQDTALRFVLQTVTFDGESVLPQTKLTPAWADYRGKPVALADLRAIGRRAELIYARAGYPFVAVLLKVQSVHDGVVHFDVVEGRISDLTVLGQNVTARRQATAALQPLVDRQPLSLADVETAYQLGKRVPGLSIAGALRRGSQPGGMDLVVAAKREDPWRAYVDVNNLYADPVGPWGVLAGVDYSGDAEFGDQASLQAYTSIPTGRQVLVRGSYWRGLNSRGTAIALSGLWGRADPKGSLANLALVADIAAFRVDLSQALWERQDGSLIGDLALDVSDQRTRVFTTVGLSDDKLRIFSASLTGERTGIFGRWAGSLELRQGLDFAGASRKGDTNLSRLGGDPEATVYKAAIEGQTPAVAYVSLLARGEFQYSSRALTAPDQYTVGNLTIGRGYQPGAALGDSAIATSFEVRVGPFKPASGIQVQPFAFIDAVRLYNHGPDPFTARILSSMGGGVRVQVAKALHVDLLYAVPQTPPLGLGEKRPSPAVLVNVTIGLNDAFEAIHRRLAHGASK
jgi:hemolysin activation/secretion protein